MAPEIFAGKSVRCAYCGASIPVPAPADQAVERIKKAGGTVSLNLDERGRDGGRVRRIEYVTASGEKKTELIPQNDSAAPLSRAE